VEKLLEQKNSLKDEKTAFSSEEKKKSVTRAVLYSLLLPGAGQFYVEEQNRGKIFLGTEFTFWSGFFAFRTYGSWLKKEYKSYAAVHANAIIQGKSDEFFKDLTYYINRDEYNKLGPLYFGKESPVYPETDFWNWQWESQQAQKHYREMRNKSKSSYRKALYMVGLAMANRLVSAVDAFRLAKIYNRKKGLEFSQFKINFESNPFGKNPHFRVILSKEF
jgi:TM2 domain-containing membrane protein YozV